MSTKAIRAVLAAFKKQCEADQHGISAAEALRHAEALAEVEAIEKAARDMRALAPAELVDIFKTNPTAPEVVAWLTGYERLLAIAAQAPVEKVAPPPEPA